MKELTISKHASKRLTKERIKEIENELDVKIKKYGEDVEIEGEAINEWTAENIINAIGMGFLLKDALKLKNDEYYFEKVSTTDYFANKEKLIKRYSSRLIGTNGTVKKTIEELTDVKLVVNDEENQIGLIGTYEDMKIAKKAIQMLFEGLNHTTVYKFLERKKESTKYDHMK